MKTGDKVRCIKEDCDIKVGKEYTVTRGDFMYSDNDNNPCVEVDGNGPYYANYFELINSKPSMEEQIALAKSYIGKIAVNGHFVIKKVNVVLSKDEASRLDIASGWVCDDIGKNGFSVVVSDNTYAYPVLMANIKPDALTVKLNAAYNAEVTKDTINVGCQTFPISILDELVKAHKSLL